jgi:multiple sugar transport system permease protein
MFRMPPVYLRQRIRLHMSLHQRSYMKRVGRFGIYFVIPALVFFLAFSFFPMLYSIGVSFFDYDLITKPVYSGLSNYRNILTDPAFWRSVKATLIYVFGTCIPIWITSFLLGLLLSKEFRGRGFFRSVTFIPVIMSLVVWSIIWKFMFHPYGIVNTMLSWIGLKESYHWLTDKTLAPLALIILSIWKGTPYYAVIFLAGIQNIPNEYYEAATIDGASGFRRLFSITLPLLKPTILFVIVISVIIGLRVFIPQEVITDGGPADATRVMTLFIYQTAFRFYKMSKAATMSFIMFLFITIFAVFQFRMLREKE